MILNNINIEEIQYSTCGYAKQEAVFDDNKQMVDYIYLDVNQSFEELMGLKKEDMIGKRFLRDIATDEDQAVEWIKECEKVVNENSPIIFEGFENKKEQHFSVIVYLTKNKQFVTLLLDRNIENKMQEISKYFNNAGRFIDYDKITKFAYELSGAQYAILNLYDENKNTLTTVSMYGVTNRLQKRLKSLEIDLLKTPRSYHSVKEMLKDISSIDGIYNFLQKKIPENVARQLEKTLDIGNVVVAKIIKDNKLLGDFTLFYKKSDSLLNRSVFQLFLTQFGIFLEKTRLEQALKLSQNRFYTLAQYAPVGFISCDTDGEITYANKKILDLLNLSSFEETRNLNIFESSSMEKYGFSQKLSECIEKDKGVMYEFVYKNMQGEDSWFRVYFEPYKEDGQIMGANIVIDDITEIKTKEEALKEVALHDQLTDAYNRHALVSILPDRLIISEEQQFIDCFALVNIDGFKNINDQYGHEVADRVLKYLVSRVMKEFRGNDLIVRMGGDEFLIYFQDIKQVENASCIIDRVFHKISTKYRFIDDMDGSCYSLDITCSIGVSIFPEDGNSVNDLVQKANAALCKVKESEKHIIIWNHDLE